MTGTEESITLGVIEILRCDGHHKKSLSHEPWWK
jgi:hypothetical protein